jgi:hypothetical protein
MKALSKERKPAVYSADTIPAVLPISRHLHYKACSNKNAPHTHYYTKALISSGSSIVYKHELRRYLFSESVTLPGFWLVIYYITPVNYFFHTHDRAQSGDRILVEARIFAHVQTGPGAHSTSCRVGTGSFPGVNRPRRGAEYQTPSSAEVENE